MAFRAPACLLAAVLLVACASPAPPSASSSVGAQGSGLPGASTSRTSTSPAASVPASTASSPDPSQGPSATPPSPAGGLDPALAARLQSALDRTRSKAGVPGLSVAVLLDDGRFWSGTSGVRQVSTSAAVDANTVFAIASITKTFVTAAVMQLAGEGKLSLSDHLDRWLPSVRNARRVTIAELLSHTSGIYNYFENPTYDQTVFSHPKKRWTFDQILALVKAPYCAPNACYHYSNTNFVLLGRIVELVTGNSLAAELHARFDVPLSLGHTGLQPADPTTADRAHAYTGTTDWTGSSNVIPTMSAATVAGAAGAMVSTPSDLAHWASQLYTGGVVPQPELAQMLTFQECHDNYGLGTRKYVINGRVAYGHLGSLRGYMDAMWYFPAEKATLVVLSNLGGWNLDGGVRRLQKVLMDGIGAPAPALDPSTNTRNHDGVTLVC